MVYRTEYTRCCDCPAFTTKPPEPTHKPLEPLGPQPILRSSKSINSEPLEIWRARSKKRCKNESKSGKCLRNDRLARGSMKFPEPVSDRHFLDRFLERNCSLSGRFGLRTAHFRDPPDRKTKGYPFTNLPKTMDFGRFVFWDQCTIFGCRSS